MTTGHFEVTLGRGFKITFENGYTVSVQFGPANYCSNYSRNIGVDEKACGEEGSPDAETALIHPSDDFVDYEGEQVQANRTPTQVLELLNFASKLPGK